MTVRTSGWLSEPIPTPSPSPTVINIPLSSQPQMANPRRVPAPSIQSYSAVPTSPRSTRLPQNPQYVAPPPQPTRTPSVSSQMQSGRGAIAQGVATGAIGAGYGPYSYNPNTARENGYNSSRFSHAPSEGSSVEKFATAAPNTSTVPAYLWDTKDPDLDDALHNPDPIRDAALDRSFTLFSARGWANASALFILVVGLITLFAGYPVIAWVRRHQLAVTGYNLGGINGTGQVPLLPNMPTLIDPETDPSAYTHTGTDGSKYNLVFSDEFNTDGRTFWPGDDPFWEAANLHYWPTGDLEWYDPQAITTANGQLVITMSEMDNHELNFQSGMLTSWNKLCFTTAYVEVSISLPGSPQVPGLWPASWLMGNLGRAGYGATTEGMWPYSYDTCDVGTFPNQTTAQGLPAAALTGDGNGGPISYLPGQRLSSCTCPGSDHPGPNVGTGRGVPEIDILEAQVDVSVFEGQVSQSFQTAPYNYEYNFVNTTPATTIYNSAETSFNTYKGGVDQQALSAVTYVDSSVYNNNAYAPYGVEWWSNPSSRSEGYISWFSGGQEAWTITAATIAADPITQISARLIPEEPMYMIFNLGMSPGFQKQDFQHLQFPATMYVDYIRVYQKEGVKHGLTCDPPSYPTADYINAHPPAYTNPNWTTWASAGYTFPRNSQYDGC